MSSFQLNAPPIASGQLTGNLPGNANTLLWSDYVTSYSFANLMSASTFTEENSTISGTFSATDSAITSYSLQLTGDDGSWLSITNMGNWSVIPEPSTIFMLTLGLVGIALFGKRKNGKNRPISKG